MNFEFAPELLAGISGIVLSLGFNFIPGLNVRYAVLTKETKSLIMLGILAVTSGVVLAGTCYGLFNSGLTCDAAGGWRVVSIFITTLLSNQSMYTITPQTKAVLAAKLARPIVGP